MTAVHLTLPHFGFGDLGKNDQFTEAPYSLPSCFPTKIPYRMVYLPPPPMWVLAGARVPPCQSLLVGTEISSSFGACFEFPLFENVLQE
jgi:hypothetical protein